MNFSEVVTSGVESDVVSVAAAPLNQMLAATIDYRVTVIRSFMMGFAFHCASVGSPACVFYAISMNV